VLPDVHGGAVTVDGPSSVELREARTASPPADCGHPGSGVRNGCSCSRRDCSSASVVGRPCWGAEKGVLEPSPADSGAERPKLLLNWASENRDEALIT
jgi:hypothetical protein